MLKLTVIEDNNFSGGQMDLNKVIQIRLHSRLLNDDDPFNMLVTKSLWWVPELIPRVTKILGIKNSAFTRN